MRTIKFRAYVKKEGEIVDIDVIDFTGDATYKKGFIACVYGQGFNRDNETGEEDCVFGLDEVELMLFTGLKDKNSVDIYEGDILDGQSGINNFPSRYGVVRWVEAGFRFSWLLTWKDNLKVSPYEDEHYWNSIGENTKYLEVIGNIYENPELLQAKLGGE